MITTTAYASTLARLLSEFVDSDPIAPVLPPFLPDQQIVYDSPARFKVLACGRRWGKTTFCSIEAITCAMRGGRAWWVAPTYDLTRVGYRAMKQLVHNVRGINIIKSERLFEFPGGGWVQIRSAHDPDSLRGEGLDLVVFDEAAFGLEEAWTDSLAPTLADREGKALLVSTPNGRNWFWRLWERGQRGELGWASWQMPTHRNPKIKREELEQWQATLPEDTFRQEYLAEFIVRQGLIYTEFDERVHVFTTTRKRDEFQNVIAGVDWGYSNPGVILVVGFDADGRAMVVHEEYHTRRRIEEWVNIAKQLQEDWGISVFYCDPSEPSYLRQFSTAGLNVMKANNTVLPGIQAVKELLVVQADGRPRLQLHSECIMTKSEFGQYVWATNVHGVRDAPLKANDHAMDALRYAIMAARMEFGMIKSYETNPFYD